MSAEWHRDWRDRARRRKLACGRAPTWPWRKGLAYTPVLTRRPWVASNLSVVTGLTFSSGPAPSGHMGSGAAQRSPGGGVPSEACLYLKRQVSGRQLCVASCCGGKGLPAPRATHGLAGHRAPSASVGTMKRFTVVHLSILWFSLLKAFLFPSSNCL